MIGYGARSEAEAAAPWEPPNHALRPLESSELVEDITGKNAEAFAFPSALVLLAGVPSKVDSSIRTGGGRAGSWPSLDRMFTCTICANSSRRIVLGQALSDMRTRRRSFPNVVDL